MMNGSKKTWGRQNGTSTSTNIVKRPVPVAALLEAEQALSHEERVRKALNLKPYLIYLSDLFAQRLRDSSDSEGDEQIPSIPAQNQLHTQCSVEEASKCPAITQAIHTLNLNLEEMPSQSASSFLDHTGKTEPEEFPSASQFSPSNSYSSSLGLSPESTENEKHDEQEGSELPPISDLELHKYLDKPVHEHNSPANEYMISYLNSTNSDFKMNRKRKWEHENSNSLLSELKRKSPFSSSGGVPDLIAEAPSHLNVEDPLLSVHGIDGTDSKESTLKIKEDPDKLLMTKGYDDFRDYMKSSITHDKLNLNQTAREDNEEECADVKDGEDAKKNEEMDDEDDDSLSDYMNITANSALALDTFFKFDTDDLTSAAQSPMSPTPSHIPPSLSNQSVLSRTEIDDSPMEESGLSITSETLDRKIKKLSIQKQARTVQMLNIKRRKIYTLMCKKEVTKVARTRTNLHQEVLAHTKQLVEMCSRHLYDEAIESQKLTKDSTWRAARLTDEMQGMWKQMEHTEKEIRRREIRAAEDQKRLDLQLSEAREQQQKLNILTMQISVYASLISDKLNHVQTTKVEQGLIDHIEEIRNSVLLYPGDYYEWELTQQCISRSVKTASELHTKHLQEYLSALSVPGGSESETTINKNIEKDEVFQPGLFTGTLKSFQQNGIEWLINLFDLGLNGILADETGLGKRVQLLALLGYLAENRSSWGPVLIIASASAQQTWQQEFEKFLPSFTARIYSGNSQERKVLRGTWLLSTGLFGTEQSIFHVLITSHQIVAADLKHLNRVKWQYLILDEPQTATGMKWKAILGLNCRSRLFLTARPIPNTIHELWKSLHFVIPSIFDADEEFGEWASKNIDPHTDIKFTVEEKNLGCLRRALKSFILRRTKKDVVNELPEKVEFLIPCPLTSRQRLLNSGIKRKILIEDLHKPVPSSRLTQIEIANLMNFAMQLRKVSNHPDLIEKREVKSPFYMNKIVELYPKTLFAEGLLYETPALKHHLFENHLNIYNPIYTHGSFNCSRRVIASSLEELATGQRSTGSEWSFSRFIGVSPKELFDLAMGGYLQRWTHILQMQEIYESLCRRRLWKTNNEETSTKYLSPHDFSLYPNSAMSFPNVESTPILKDLAFVSPAVPVYAFLDEKISAIVDYPFHPSKSSGKQKELRPLKVESTRQISKAPIVRTLVPTFLPRCISQQMCPKVFSGGRSFTCRIDAGGIYVEEPEEVQVLVPPIMRNSFQLVKPQNGWSSVSFPNKDELLTDSGKLRLMDQLIYSLKQSERQVIIYTHMKQMLGILEEFLAFRKWNYVLLDSSLKKRDLTQHESRPEFLVLLGWTRACNLGINLTFVDSVIFYDSGWNPAVDREALDRTYRLGRTKKLTVFRLVSEGTIEFSILEKTTEKSLAEGFNWDVDSDALKPAELVSLLLKDEELKLLACDREENPCVDVDPKSVTLKRKSCPVVPYKSFKEIFARKFKTREREPSSSVASSVSVTGSSPTNSDIEGVEEGEPEVLDEDMESGSAEDEELERAPHDIDCVDGPLPCPSRSNPNLMDWNTGSVSDYDEDLGLFILNRPKVGRGGRRRGRPPTRVRVMSRDDDGSRRGRPVGRPRKRIGPPNQGIRGRKPGRPPLTKRAEILMPATLPLTQSDDVFGDSSPGIEST